MARPSFKHLKSRAFSVAIMALMATTALAAGVAVTGAVLPNQASAATCDPAGWQALHYPPKLAAWLEQTKNDVTADDLAALTRMLNKQQRRHRPLPEGFQKEYERRIHRFIDTAKENPTGMVRGQLIFMSHFDLVPSKELLEKIFNKGLILEGSDNQLRTIANSLYGAAVLGVEPPGQRLQEFYRAYKAIEALQSEATDPRHINQMRFVDAYYRGVRGHKDLPELNIPLAGARDQTDTPAQTYAAIALEDLGDRVRSEVFIPELNTHIDFLVDGKTIIEVDGPIHYWLDGAGGRTLMLKDQRRDEILRSMGYRIERIPNEEITKIHKLVDSLK